MLLIVEEGIRGGIYYTIYWYVKAYIKYMKNYETNKVPSKEYLKDAEAI